MSKYSYTEEELQAVVYLETYVDTELFGRVRVDTRIPPDHRDWRTAAWETAVLPEHGHTVLTYYSNDEGDAVRSHVWTLRQLRAGDLNRDMRGNADRIRLPLYFEELGFDEDFTV